MALVMGDVDWFKAYNDRNGHEAGQPAAARARPRPQAGHPRGGPDLPLRRRGVPLLPDWASRDVEEAALLTERIRKNVEDHYFELQEFQPRGNLTMSFGVTVFPKSLGDPSAVLTKADLKRLAGEADLALAEAKGKERPDLVARGAAEPPPSTRTASAASSGRSSARPPGRATRAAADRPSARSASTTAITSPRRSSSMRTAGSRSPRPSTSASKGRASSPTRPCRRARPSKRSSSSRTGPRRSRARSSTPKRAGASRASSTRG